MSELGLRLKSAREELGLSLEELQVKTKIQKRYLSAIEEGEFSRLPGEFYARAFVKSYAEAVGLEPELLLEEHSAELPGRKQEPADLPPRVNRKKASTKKGVKKSSSKMSSFVNTVIIIVIAAVLLTIAVIFFQNQAQDGAVQRETSSGDFDDSQSVADQEEDNTAEDETSENETEDTSEGADLEGEQEEPAQGQELEQNVEDISGFNSIVSVANTEEFNVRVEISGTAWLQLSDGDGDIFTENEYAEGDEFTYDLTETGTIEVNTGYAPNIQVFVNGELIQWPIDPGAQDRQRMTINYQPAS
ncbi:helix-turn-helix domain-containing protein [Alteribacter lacisalsi]|uniref:helix-turn-helix domain-containing protein n=1 Tax=Alteribacter lacisalsi TaxID=2045244 RepID=UPI001374D176|nr:RodZ domain-containing protein [Alteribacter lacisalsi]